MKKMEYSGYQESAPWVENLKKLAGLNGGRYGGVDTSTDSPGQVFYFSDLSDADDFEKDLQGCDHSYTRDKDKGKTQFVVYLSQLPKYKANTHGSFVPDECDTAERIIDDLTKE